jgi:hypothetical protein
MEIHNHVIMTLRASVCPYTRIAKLRISLTHSLFNYAILAADVTTL